MLTGKILNSNASLNDFRYIDSIEFIVGSGFTLAFRIFNKQLNERHVPPSTAIIKIFLNQTDGTQLEKTTTAIDDGDRSMQNVDIDATETENLMGGNIVFQVDVLGDGTQIEKGIIPYALSKISTSSGGSCC